MGRRRTSVWNAPSRTMKQKILVLYLHNPDLNSRVVAWSMYDGTGAQPDVPVKDNRYGAPTGSAADPPYESVVDAMRDGWRVVQFPHRVQGGHGGRGSSRDLALRTGQPDAAHQVYVQTAAQPDRSATAVVGMLATATLRRSARCCCATTTGTGTRTDWRS